VGVTKTLIKLKLGLKIKVKEAVPNCLISKETLVKEDPELESIMVSGDERSRSTETSSPVIKVYGSTGVDVALKLELKTTELTWESDTSEAADRKSPYGAWATGRKSEANGVSE